MLCYALLRGVLLLLLQSCRLMYDLPSGEADVSGTLVDLIDDEDLEMMWEELDVMQVRPGVLCVRGRMCQGKGRRGEEEGGGEGRTAACTSVPGSRS